MWVFGYDYYGQSGEYWNELYTYDKAWNDSSTSNTQKITGINNNNYWIQRYGADFFPYRAMGWHDVNWRRPNQRRSDGISIGDTGSSPMEYTNGSHPRYFYLGNRYVSVCKHCTICSSCSGLKTGKAIFISATGATLEYDIENWTSQADTRDNGPRVGHTAADCYYKADGTTGTIYTQEDSDILKDSLIFRLTTDPADDGIPAIKKVIKGTGSQGTTGWNFAGFYQYNVIRVTGLGVMIPFYDTATQSTYGLGLGGPIGGFGPSQVWSGDSGTMQGVLNPVTGQWLVTQTFGSTSIPDFSNTLRIWTGDLGYETIEPFERPSDNYYRLENPAGLGTTGATYTIELNMIAGASAAAFLSAESPVNTAESLLEFSSEISENIIPPVFDPQEIFIQHGPNSPPSIPTDKIFYVPYVSDGYTTDREIVFLVNNQDNSNSSDFTWTSDPTIPYQTGSISVEDPITGEILGENQRQVSNTFGGSNTTMPNKVSGICGDNLTQYIGKTLDVVMKVFDVSGRDTLSESIAIRGMTGSTGPGLTYEKGLNQIRFDLTSGTQLELFPENRLNVNYSATWDQNGGHVERSNGNDTGFFNLPSIPERDGQTFNIEMIIRGGWDRNDGILTIGQQYILGATYQARPD